MSRDTWQLRRPVIQIKKLRKTLTLPSASYACFRNNASVLIGIGIPGPFQMAQSLPASLQLVSALTVECWIRPSGVGTNSTMIGLSIQYMLQLTPTFQLRGVLNKGGAQAFTSAGSVSPYQWNHVAMTWDGTTAYLYINGIRDANSLAVAANLDNVGTVFNLFGSVGGSTYGGEARVWNRALTADEIFYKYNKPRSLGLTNIDAGLIAYWKVNEGTGTTFFNSIPATVLDFNFPAAFASWSSEIYPPLIFGVSFVIAQTEIDLGKATSLVFPEVPADNITGMLCVSFIDDEGETQRYKLWALIGVDIAPLPTTYTGQKVNSPFWLEWWNIDGAETVEIPSELVIEVADTTNPNDSGDTTHQVAATITMDTTLAESFPLTNFPLEFDTQQVYV